MDLTFQVPMQYCSLQHQTLLLSPVTSTAEIRDTKGTFHAKIGSIKDRNGMDLTEAGHILIKRMKIKHKEQILKAARESNK